MAQPEEVQNTILQVPPALAPARSTSPNPNSQLQGGLAVFSGGSAANNLVDVFEQVREANQCTLSYVIPISDNGGSSSEIIRVFGGPGMCESPSSHCLSHTCR